MSSNQSELPAVVRQCIEVKLHLTWCDDDGYCNYCGHQESEQDIEDNDPENPPIPPAGELGTGGWPYGPLYLSG